MPQLDDSLNIALTDASSLQVDELKAAKETIAAQNLPAGFALMSFERASDAIKNGIRVFISYKSIHHALAEAFCEKIKAYGQSRLAKDQNGEPSVFIAEQRLQAGKPYQAQIEDEINKAHWFFLLLPDPQFDREWPIWEAGYFQRGMTASERLICVHPESVATAAQIQNLQAYEGSLEGLQQLFTQIFFEKQAVPGMNAITYLGYKQNLLRDMKELSDLFTTIKGAPAPPVPDFYGRFIEIEHRADIRYDKPEDLLSLKILGMKNLNEAFNRLDTFQGTFGELIANVNDDAHGRQWMTRSVAHCAISSQTTSREQSRCLFSALSEDGRSDQICIAFGGTRITKILNALR